MNLQTRLLLAAGAALTVVCAPAQAQWVTLTNSGTPILSTINPKTVVSPTPATCTNNGLPPTELPVETQSATLATGKFAGLPGSAAMTGYRTTPFRTASSPISIGTPAKTVGTLYTRVYCAGTASACSTASPNTYVFATRVILNSTVWSSTGLSFEVNDIFLSVPSAATITAGYYMGTSGGAAPDNSQAFKYLEYAGRTNNGLLETIGRNNAYVAFRADTNANDPDRCEPYSRNSSNSPWVYARMACSSISASTSTFKVRIRQGNEEGQGVYSVSLPGFVCTP